MRCTVSGGLEPEQIEHQFLYFYLKGLLKSVCVLVLCIGLWLETYVGIKVCIFDCVCMNYSDELVKYLACVCVSI